LKFLIEEENGFTHWLWEIDASWEEVKDLLDSKIRQKDFYSGKPGLPITFPDGDWTEIKFDEYMEIHKLGEYDAIGSLHTDKDSWYNEKKEFTFDE
jgi:hypothetical protein